MRLNGAQAKGRMIAAARVVLGLEQADLAREAELSPSTISNAERGATEIRRETYKKIRKALRELGATYSHDRTNGNIVILTNYKLAELDDED